MPAWKSFTYDNSSGGTWMNMYGSRPSDGILCTIDFGNLIELDGIQFSNGHGCDIKDFEVYTSNDGNNFNLYKQYTVPNLQYTPLYNVLFDNVISTRFLRFNLLSSYNSSNGVYFTWPVTYFILHKKYLIRSLSGGNAYLGTDGKANLVNNSLGGYPNINEWDKCVVNSDLKGKITPGDDNIWHHNRWCWVGDTPINQLKNTQNTISATSIYKIGRGYNDIYGNVNRFDIVENSYSDSNGGFRPVLQYIESNSKQTNLWY
jgi:hypothetical protein